MTARHGPPDLLPDALRAAMRGWHVFPCHPGDKRPAVKDWPNKATTNVDRILRYWEKHPTHNVGIACGPSRLVVVDLDAAKDKPLPAPWDEPGVRDGLDVWAVLRERHDPSGPAWLATHTVATPSGGRHLYFAAETPPANTAGRLGPLVDTRGSGGYVVGAGSVVGARPYEVLDDADPAPLPTWLTTLLTPPPPPARPAWIGERLNGERGRVLEGLVRTVLEAPVGQRNATLNWAAFRAGEHATAGRLDETEAAKALYAAGVQAGLTETETRRTITSGLRSGHVG